MSPEVFEQFEELIETLQDYFKQSHEARMNREQPEWLVLSEKSSSREELLEKVDRADINEKIKEMSEKMGDVTAGTMMVAMLQHDYVAAIARDYFHVRRSRLQRLSGQVAVDNGLGHDKGVLKEIVLKYIEKLTKVSNGAV